MDSAAEMEKGEQEAYEKNIERKLLKKIERIKEIESDEG